MFMGIIHVLDIVFNAYHPILWELACILLFTLPYAHKYKYYITNTEWPGIVIQSCEQPVGKGGREGKQTKELSQRNCFVSTQIKKSWTAKDLLKN